MPVDTTAGLIDDIRRHRLLEPAQLAELDRLQTAFPAPRALAAELIRRVWLTPYQVNQLLQGRGAGLLLGSYVLLERLGEGGMGEVFKARNWKLGQVVALKLIRKERLDNPDALRRFQREIRAAAQLDHPHIVRAYDADEVGGVYLLVLEYVQGTDLSKLVKQGGPLPVDQACDYARQAALGLQHAGERGLVHRDIKPHNLLRTPQGVVKILDMGLARLHRAADDEASGTMTREGTVMGTLDYISPEQAMDSHHVDIRADLYSLGCTLYFLLTGKPPFPGGEALQKLLKHRLEEPVPVEQVRRDVPPGVAAVVRKLMAKRPEDRFQTPDEAATALAVAAAAPLLAGATIPAEGQAAPARDLSDAADRTAADGDTDAALRWVDERRRQRKAEERRRVALYAVGGLLSLVLAGLFVLLFLHFGLPANKPPVPPDPNAGSGPASSPAVRAVPFDPWLKDTAALPAERQVKAVAEELKKRNPGFDGAVKPTIENGVVVGLEFLTDAVTDVAPLRALPGLTNLHVVGSGAGKSRLSDLSPLKEMELTSLACYNTNVADLSPLKGMPLTTLLCNFTGVSDLAPLKGMPLTYLDCNSNPISDLSPLKEMKLTFLDCGDTKVTNLSPLKTMPLTVLSCPHTLVSDLSPIKNAPLTFLRVDDTRVTDLSPLKEAPLREVAFDFQSVWAADVLRSVPTLKTINGKAAADFWKDVDSQRAAFEAWCKQVAAMKPDEQIEAVKAELKKRNPGFDGVVKPTSENGVVTGLEFLTDDVTDLSPVRALTGLKNLKCVGSGWQKGRLWDLSPLKGMPLTSLDCFHTLVSDLSPLKDLKLTWLKCEGTMVADLAPLKGMSLTHLYCATTKVSDLSPLKGMKLRILYCNNTKVSDLSPLAGMPLEKLWCDFQPGRDAEILRSIKTLQKINDQPAADFWKALGDAPPKP